MKLIVAFQGKDRGIGFNGQIPWHLTEDLEMFKQKTSKTNDTGDNIVIMGRKTWDSIPDKFKPLKGRKNYIVTNNTSEEFKQAIEANTGTFITNNLENTLKNMNKNDTVWIIGGSAIYNRVIELGYVTEPYKI